MNGKWKRFAQRWLGRLSNILGGLTAIATATKFWDAKKHTDPRWIGELLGWVQQYSAPLLLIFFLWTWISRVLVRSIGDYRADELARDVLNMLHKQIFPKRDDQLEPTHYRRATLFKRRKWVWAFCKWPWTGWLVPVARSGHTMLKPKTKFRAPRNDPDRAEGIGGLVWRSKGCIVITNLPALEAGAEKTQRKAFKEYCKKTGVTEDWLKRRLKNGTPVARAFWAAPIEVSNEVWGAVVLDSRTEETNKGGVSMYPELQDMSRILGKILERSQHGS